MWVPNNSTFDKFTELSFDAIVRRESVYKYRMKKVSVNNFSAYQEIMEQFNESFVNKMLIMENGEAGQEEVEEKVNYLTNEFVLEIEEKNNEENGSPIDILSWTVEVTNVPGNNLKLLSFDNEMFCQLTFKIFQEKWKLQRLNSYNEKNATIKINIEPTNDLNLITSFIHSEIEYESF
ncbi:hypothetical protein HANVADRAFT_50514 [Hanseniaspora valbyensis NRRL Y-1626]|uniref:Uncharacterized protein n=1 Tax=Hanseniaspora valbyensis NRRL Y-1626 TaxID=766949 RepID=A0A1B7T874_9ASCO|nr:hypothetical protein HANVADRAFT_50514 [Hanseniaspora valbyensis NRRL Y-1626]